MSLSQRFPSFGKLPLRSQVAYHNAMAAHAQATAVELGVTERVKRAYYDVYFLQRAIEVNRALKPPLEKVITPLQCIHSLFEPPQELFCQTAVLEAWSSAWRYSPSTER